jgi:glycosyltransferase involved in cell wall biosynthesis
MTISSAWTADVAPDARPAIAIVSNSQTPYRLHLHRRIAAEVPEIRLYSLYTHQASNSNWEYDAPAEIGPVLFGEGESSGDQDRLGRLPREWHRGGRIIRWLRTHRVQFVVMMGYNDAGRLRIMRWCRHASVPCYLFGDSNVHGDPAGGLKSLIKQRVLRRILSWCDGVLVCGTLGQRYFARYGVRADQTFLFPYEPDYNLIHQLPAELVSATAERLGLPVGRPRIVYSGRLVHVKRVDLLIDAFVAIARERPDWDLVILGAGPTQASLASRVPAGLVDRVRWLGFVGDQATVSAVYRTCHVLVLPSDYEPWALVVNEAVAAGLVVVSSVVGAAAELVIDRVNGRLFPPGDLPRLTACLLDVTTSGTTERLREAAPAVLADWRRRADPVAGLRSALARAGVLRPRPPNGANAEPRSRRAPG